VEGVRIGDRWPVGRSKKKWGACLTEDINTLEIKEQVEQ